MLVLPDFNKPFQERCDASATAIGAMLRHDDRPIAYFSEKLNEENINILLMIKNSMPWLKHLRNGGII